MDKHILTINSGSSSIKFSIYPADGDERLVSGLLDRIGFHDGSFSAKNSSGKIIASEKTGFSSHEEALERLISWLTSEFKSIGISAIGHRVVHGGPRYKKTSLITEELISVLKELMPFVPEHLPHEIKAIEAFAKKIPGIPQAAAFDTAFHRNMPKVAQLYGIPRELSDDGIIRYGFHGLSYEYIIGELRMIAPTEASGKVIVAHLGNGASITAIKDGISIDTSMGFTPAEGLLMSRRSGDIDPGILLYLLDEKGLGPKELNDLINKKSGLLGVSGISTDARDLLASTDERAKDAIGLFCYRVKKYIGAYVAALGGLDSMVFTAGIGENSPDIREKILRGLECFHIYLDNERNTNNAPVISTDESPVMIRVMPTNEELIIARQTRELVMGKKD